MKLRAFIVLTSAAYISCSSKHPDTQEISAHANNEFEKQKHIKNTARLYSKNQLTRVRERTLLGNSYLISNANLTFSFCTYDNNHTLYYAKYHNISTKHSTKHVPCPSKEQHVLDQYSLINKPKIN